jgi:hypothetical protein
VTACDVPCLVCGRELDQVFDGGSTTMQPGDGVYCQTGGNYGSTVFDQMGRVYLAFLICDGCLVSAGQQGRVVSYQTPEPADPDYEPWGKRSGRIP